MVTRGLWEDFLCGSSLFSFQRMTFLSCFTFQAGSGNQPKMIKTRNGNITARAPPQSFGVLTQSQRVVIYCLINLNNWWDSTFGSGKVDHSSPECWIFLHFLQHNSFRKLLVSTCWNSTLCRSKKSYFCFWGQAWWNKNHPCVPGGLFSAVESWYCFITSKRNGSYYTWCSQG